MTWDFHKKVLLVILFMQLMGIVIYGGYLALAQVFATPEETVSQLINGVINAQLANCTPENSSLSEDHFSQTKRVIAEYRRSMPYAWASIALNLIWGLVITYLGTMLLVSKLAKTVVIIGGKTIELKS